MRQKKEMIMRTRIRKRITDNTLGNLCYHLNETGNIDLYDYTDNQLKDLIRRIEHKVFIIGEGFEGTIETIMNYKPSYKTYGSLVSQSEYTGTGTKLKGIVIEEIRGRKLETIGIL